MEWISIDDRLPNDLEDILMTYNNLVLSGWFDDGRFYYTTSMGNTEEQEGITHWMQFPSPPKKV